MDTAAALSAAKSASGKGRGEGAGAALYSFLLGGARLAAVTPVGAAGLLATASASSGAAPAVVLPVSRELRKSAAALVAEPVAGVSLLSGAVLLTEGRAAVAAGWPASGVRELLMHMWISSQNPMQVL